MGDIYDGPRDPRPGPQGDRSPDDPEEIDRDRIIDDDDLIDIENPVPEPDTDIDEEGPLISDPDNPGQNAPQLF